MAVSRQPAAKTKKTIRKRGSRAGENSQEKSHRSSKKVDIVFLILSDVNLFSDRLLEVSGDQTELQILRSS